MNILSIDKIYKSYGEKILLENASVSILTGDKIGVIGVNGTGKSTFLKIIAGIEKAEKGEMIGSFDGMSYLSQNPTFNYEATLLQQVFSGESEVLSLIREYEEQSNGLEKNPLNKELQKKLIETSSKMDILGAWEMESEAKTILTKLGISDFDKKIGELSGGQRKRVALATTLIRPSELLILDEPTNHLDSDTIEWLEDYLNKRKGALIMVTHDRYFLDRVVNKIIEIDRGNLYYYPGNYSEFLEKKEERLETELSSESKRQNLLKKELAWMRKGAKARTTKQKARIDRYENLKDEKYETINSDIEIDTAATRLGKKVVEFDNITKSFDGKCLINGFTYIVTRDDRIGIVGSNGIGKSTLMNILSGEILPDSGNVDIGETVKIGYYSQEINYMDLEIRVIDYIREAGEYISTSSGEKITASQMLEKFLFIGSQQYTPIGKLSGGEKRRLYLLRTLMEAPNLLLLDEPTNDLDVETLGILEDYLENFPGAVIAVSHDRYFLDKLAEKLFIFEGNAEISIRTGNYSHYVEEKKEQIKDIKTLKNNKVKDNNNKGNSSKQGIKKLKFTFKETKEYEEIESEIELNENKLEKIENDINEQGSNYEVLNELLAEKVKLESDLEYKMDRWAYLSEKEEQIKKINN